MLATEIVTLNASVAIYCAVRDRDRERIARRGRHSVGMGHHAR